MEKMLMRMEMKGRSRRKDDVATGGRGGGIKEGVEQGRKVSEEDMEGKAMETR